MKEIKRSCGRKEIKGSKKSKESKDNEENERSNIKRV